MTRLLLSVYLFVLLVCFSAHFVFFMYIFLSCIYILFYVVLPKLYCTVMYISAFGYRESEVTVPCARTRTRYVRTYMVHQCSRLSGAWSVILRNHSVAWTLTQGDITDEVQGTCAGSSEVFDI